ncbi:MAG: hypothetical protein HYZ00_14725 [Candidatus Hydrogenedentes bacterium]|nr:hypothetical protein [Candidatus Hydrogenedentota bacterium]
MSYKTVLAIVAALVVLLALPLIPSAIKPGSGRQMDDGAQSAPLAENATEPFPAASFSIEPAPRQPPVITETQFSQVRPGMTYAQCVQLIGSEGEPAGRGGGGDEQYKWQLVNGASSSAEVTLTFRNGLLNGKGFSSNAGRSVKPNAEKTANAVPIHRPASPPYISWQVYKSLKDGSSYADCVQALGAEGTFLGRRTLSMGTTAPDGTSVPATADVYLWRDPGIPATLTLSFRDGKLTAREIAGGGAARGAIGSPR